MNRQTKINLLLHWLKAGHSISNKESVEQWNYYRLADGIFKLRGRGFNISTTMVSIGTDVTFARYQIKKALRDRAIK